MNINKDRYFLEVALEEAEKSLNENTYPVGAIIVDENQNIIAKGRNKVHPEQDATAHAEIDAIRNVGNSIFKAKINNEKFTIYTSLEPYADLKKRQMELMSKWSVNPNNVFNLRKAIVQE